MPGPIQPVSRKKKACVITLILVLNGLAMVLMAGPSRTITLEQAVKIALETNQDLRQFANQVRLNQLNLNQKKSNFLPGITVSGQSSQRYSRNQDLETNEITNASSQNVNLGASFNLNLFNGGFNRFSLRQSKLELKASGQNFTRSRQAIIFETIQRYIQVVLSQELIGVDQKNLDAQRAQMERIEAFFRSGRRPVADLYQQKAEISRYEYLLLATERNHRVNKLLLTQILGLSPSMDLEVTNPGLEKLLTRLGNFNPGKTLKRAREQRADIQAQKHLIQAAGAAIKAARSGYWPTINVYAEAGSSYSSLNESMGFSDQLLERYPNASLGLSFSLPVFDRNVTRNSVASARINLNNQELEMQKRLHQVSVEVQQAIQDYATARKQVKVAESQSKYSRQALESVQERYDVSAATMAELIQARSQFYQSQYDLVEAKFNLLIRGIAVHFYLGDDHRMLSLFEMDLEVRR